MVLYIKSGIFLDDHNYPGCVEMISQYSLLAIGAIALIARVTDAYLPKTIDKSDGAAPGEFPYQVLVHVNSPILCGGAIITSRHVITAALCVVYVPVQRIRIMVGSTDITRGNLYTVKTVKIHSANSVFSAAPYDVAILELNEEIYFDIVQNKVELPEKPTPGGVAANITGWRNLQSLVPNEANCLMKATVTTLYPIDYEKYFRSDVLGENLIFIYSKHRTGPSNGNLGSPLVGGGRLIGIDSYGTPSAPRIPGIFTSVFHLTNWIRSVIGQQ